MMSLLSLNLGLGLCSSGDGHGCASRALSPCAADGGAWTWMELSAVRPAVLGNLVHPAGRHRHAAALGVDYRLYLRCRWVNNESDVPEKAELAGGHPQAQAAVDRDRLGNDRQRGQHLERRRTNLWRSRQPSDQIDQRLEDRGWPDQHGMASG